MNKEASEAAQQQDANRASVPIWEVWSDQAASVANFGKTVEVRNIGSKALLLTGRVVPYTDLLGTGGILQPHPEQGMNRVTAALPFPHDPDKFIEEMSRFEFRVLEQSE